VAAAFEAAYVGTNGPLRAPELIGGAA
jgi:hypothetical protein